MMGLKIEEQMKIENDSGQIVLNCADIVDILQTLQQANSLMIMEQDEKKTWRFVDFEVDKWQDGNGIVIKTEKREND